MTTSEDVCALLSPHRDVVLHRLQRMHPTLDVALIEDAVSLSLIEIAEKIERAAIHHPRALWLKAATYRLRDAMRRDTRLHQGVRYQRTEHPRKRQDAANWRHRIIRVLSDAGSVLTVRQIDIRTGWVYASRVSLRDVLHKMVYQGILKRIGHGRYVMDDEVAKAPSTQDLQEKNDEILCSDGCDIC